MPADLPELFNATKELPLAPQWAERDSERLVLVSPLEIRGVVIEGLWFRATAMIEMPDEAVTCQIEYHPPRGGVGGALCRIEWRPLSGHNNKGLGPPEHQHRLIRGSHHHRFDLNWGVAPKSVRRGNLPVAVPLNDDPADFETLLALVSKEFNIANIGLVSHPPWRPVMI